MKFNMERTEARKQLRTALDQVRGLTKRHKREACEVLCRQYNNFVISAERVRIAKCAGVRGQMNASLIQVQAELIRLGLIPDCRVSGEIKTRTQSKPTRMRLARNRRKARLRRDMGQ